MGDFTGFTFGDIHSSELGITRVSGGDRYSEQLHPEIKDRTVEVPGLNGEYYFGSDYGTKTFELDIAFDSLNEYQFRRLRQIFGTKDIKKLVFDERPYKYYMVKLESPIELSYISFDEPYYTWERVQTGVDTYVPGIISDYYEHKVYDGTVRSVYKGEGTISLVAYFPFAKSNFKVLPIEGQAYYEGSASWAVSSGLLSATAYESIDIYNTQSRKIITYNPGDVATGFRLYLPAELVTTKAVTLKYKFNNQLDTAALALKQMELNNGDVGVLIDTNNRLITGVSTAPVLNPVSGEYTYTTSGNIYNKYVNSGSFFLLEPNIINTTSTIQFTYGNENIKIFYDYLYF